MTDSTFEREALPPLPKFQSRGGMVVDLDRLSEWGGQCYGLGLRAHKEQAQPPGEPLDERLNHHESLFREQLQRDLKARASLATKPPVDERRLRSSVDPSIWVEEFAKVRPDVDQGLMLGWFANCMETARTHVSDGPQPAPPVVDEDLPESAKQIIDDALWSMYCYGVERKPGREEDAKAAHTEVMHLLFGDKQPQGEPVDEPIGYVNESYLTSLSALRGEYLITPNPSNHIDPVKVYLRPAPKPPVDEPVAWRMPIDSGNITLFSVKEEAYEYALRWADGQFIPQPLYLHPAPSCPHIISSDEGTQGYIDAFYKIGDALGIPARAKSPKEVFESEMLPEIERLRKDRDFYFTENKGLIAAAKDEAHAALLAAGEIERWRKDAERMRHLLKRSRQKFVTYVSVYPGDKELRGLLKEWDAAVAAQVDSKREAGS